jgi:hypothetical protein
MISNNHQTLASIWINPRYSRVLVCVKLSVALKVEHVFKAGLSGREVSGVDLDHLNAETVDSNPA